MRYTVPSNEYPPSTSSVWPMIIDAAGDARKATA